MVLLGPGRFYILDRGRYQRSPNTLTVLLDEDSVYTNLHLFHAKPRARPWWDSKRRKGFFFSHQMEFYEATYALRFFEISVWRFLRMFENVFYVSWIVDAPRNTKHPPSTVNNPLTHYHENTCTPCICYDEKSTVVLDSVY